MFFKCFYKRIQTILISPILIVFILLIVTDHELQNYCDPSNFNYQLTLSIYA